MQRALFIFQNFPLSPTTMSEQLMYSTVQLKVATADKMSFGTAFRYACTVNGLIYSLLVTAKHVLENARAVTMSFHRCNQLPDYKGQLVHDCYETTLEELDGKCFFHPHEDIDLAAIDFEPIRVAALENCTPLFSPHADDECIFDDQWLGRNLSMVEDVIMPGYPLNIYDKVNNFPIFRRGTTASHPYVNFDGKSIGVVDIACHPGMSGAPIYVINEKQQWNGKSRDIVGIKKPILLGVLSGGQVLSRIAHLPIHADHGGPAINLGYYVKAKEVKFLGEKASEIFRGYSPVTP